MKIIVTVFLSIVFTAHSVKAEELVECECESDDWVDVCDAEFEQQGGFVTLKSNKQQCSRVDWYTGAQPRVTIIVNGVETVELLGSTRNSDISISACNVCKDSRSDSSDPNRDSQSGSASLNSPDAVFAVVLAVESACSSESRVTSLLGSREEFVSIIEQKGLTPQLLLDLAKQELRETQSEIAQRQAQGENDLKYARKNEQRLQCSVTQYSRYTQ